MDDKRITLTAPKMRISSYYNYGDFNKLIINDASKRNRGPVDPDTRGLIMENG